MKEDYAEKMVLDILGIKKLKTKEELEDDLCGYCPLPEESRGVRCYGGEPVMCEGSHCDEAYDNYLDECEDN